MSLNTILATAPLVSTNYILKATGTTIGNSSIFDNGTNVGIGNTNTSYTLDVTGTGRFTGVLTSAGLTTTGAISLTPSTFSVGSASAADANALTIQAANSNYLLKFKNAAGTSIGGFYYDGTNFIADSPSWKFTGGDVTMSASSGVRILSVQTAGIEGRITATTGAWYIGSQSAVPLVFTAGGAGMMSIATSGNVSYVASLIPTAAVNSGFYTIDSAANTISLGANGAVNIGGFSGMVLVTNTANGNTMLFLCGGGTGVLVSQSIGGAAGTMTNFAGSGYTFTTAYTATASYSFQIFRTRVIA